MSTSSATSTEEPTSSVSTSTVTSTSTLSQTGTNHESTSPTTTQSTKTNINSGRSTPTSGTTTNARTESKATPKQLSSNTKASTTEKQTSLSSSPTSEKTATRNPTFVTNKTIFTENLTSATGRLINGTTAAPPYTRTKEKSTLVTTVKATTTKITSTYTSSSPTGTPTTTSSSTTSSASSISSTPSISKTTTTLPPNICPNNKIFKPCVRDCEHKCPYLLTGCIESQRECKPGCGCPDDLVSNGTFCVLPSSCSCYDSVSKDYHNPEDRWERNCEVCTCFNGQTRCSPKTGECCETCPLNVTGKPAVTTQKTCLKDEFMCTDRKCIPKEWYCDHERDCSDASDERFCNSTKTECFKPLGTAF